MYELKPILHPVQVELPTCMYHMKGINCNNAIPSAAVSLGRRSPNTNLDISQQIKNILMASNSTRMASLQQRQEKIMLQLTDLKAQLMSMHKGLNICAKPAQVPAKKTATKSVAFELPIDISLLSDVVVHCNPQNIPYSLLAVRNLWQNRLHLEIDCHSHSTVAKLPKQAIEFQDKVHAGNKVESCHPILKVTLIWNDIPNTEMICQSMVFVPIFGEVNILRYLSRIGPNEQNYENDSKPTQIDAILDNCYRVVKLPKERKAIVKDLTASLGKQEYFAGDHLTVGDVAVWSVIKQLNLAKEFNPKWLQRVEMNCNV